MILILNRGQSWPPPYRSFARGGVGSPANSGACRARQAAHPRLPMGGRRRRDQASPSTWLQRPASRTTETSSWQRHGCAISPATSPMQTSGSTARLRATAELLLGDLHPNVRFVDTVFRIAWNAPSGRPGGGRDVRRQRLGRARRAGTLGVRRGAASDGRRVPYPRRKLHQLDLATTRRRRWPSGRSSPRPTTPGPPSPVTGSLRPWVTRSSSRACCRASASSTFVTTSLGR